MDGSHARDHSSCRLNRRLLLGGVAGSALGLLAGGIEPAAAAPATSISRGPTGSKLVALTIDCGSDRGYGGTILDTLAARGVKCSFGMTGMWAQANPDLLRRIVNEGHHLINHTNTHPSFTGASTPGTGVLSYAQRKSQIETTEQIIVNLTGATTKPWFRPPYGDMDSAGLTLLGELGYHYNALWTVDLLGWNGLSQDQIVSRAANNHGNGYIYLLHAGGSSQEGPALSRVITTLQEKGYGFATLPNLMAGSGTTPPPPPPPPAQFAAGDRVRVTAGLYLRTGAGTGSGVITTMPTGTIGTVVSGPTAANGYSWYQLDTSYGRGWAAGEFLQKTTSAPPPPPPPPPAQFAAGDTVRVTAGLYLRNGSGTGSGVKTTMPTGTVCTVVSGPVAANGYAWYQLDTPYGRGWAAGQFLEKTTAAPPPPPPPAQFAAGDTVRVTAGLYLRTGSGTGSGVITTMPTGTIGTVVSGPTAANGYSWYQLDTSYGRGWAAGEYLEKTTTAPPPPPPPPPTGGFASGDRVRVTAGLYLRTGSGFSTTVITTMPTGTVCTVVSGPVVANDLNWYQLDTPYGRGWAAGEYLARTDSTPAAPTGHAPGTQLRTTANLRLRGSASASAGIVATMPAGTICTVVSGPQPAGGYTWYQVDSSYGRGWAAGEYLVTA